MNRRKQNRKRNRRGLKALICFRNRGEVRRIVWAEDHMIQDFAACRDQASEVHLTDSPQGPPLC